MADRPAVESSALGQGEVGPLRVAASMARHGRPMPFADIGPRRRHRNLLQMNRRADAGPRRAGSMLVPGWGGRPPPSGYRAAPGQPHTGAPEHARRGLNRPTYPAPVSGRPTSSSAASRRDVTGRWQVDAIKSLITVPWCWSGPRCGHYPEERRVARIACPHFSSVMHGTQAGSGRDTRRRQPLRKARSRGPTLAATLVRSIPGMPSRVTT